MAFRFSGKEYVRIRSIAPMVAARKEKPAGVYPHRHNERQKTHYIPSGQYPHSRPLISGLVRFHDVHGVNIEVTEDKTVASRLNSFCYAIAFTSRPINIEERLCLKLNVVENSWSGVMRFGFTNKDPADLQQNELPRYACPDLTNQVGYWAKALPERFARQDNILSFYVTHTGSIFYSINDKLEGSFIEGVDVRTPLWGLFDVYGNTTSLKLIDSVPTNSFRRSLNAEIFSEDMTSLQNLIPQDMESEVRQVFRVTDPIAPIRFSSTFGPSLECKSRKVLIRKNPSMDSALDSALAFTSLSLKAGQTVYFYCAETKFQRYSFLHQLGFGVGITTCDPSTISASELPLDSMMLLDRPEYWIVHKDMQSPDEKEYFAICVENDSSLTYKRQGYVKETLFYLDTSQPVYLVLDLCGEVSSIAIVGVSTEPKYFDVTEDDMQLCSLNLQTTTSNANFFNFSYQHENNLAANLNQIGNEPLINSSSYFGNNDVTHMVEESEIPSTSDAASTSGNNRHLQQPAQEETNTEGNSSLSPRVERQLVLSEDHDPTNANNLLTTGNRRTETLPQNGVTIGDVATIAAPLVITALTWLGNRMVNSLRSNEGEPAVAGNQTEVGAQSDSDSSNEEEEEDANSEISENRNDDSDEENYSSSVSSDSLSRRFDINSHMLEMLSDLGELSQFNDDHRDEEFAGAQQPSTSGTSDTRPETPLSDQKAFTDVENEGNKECVVCCDNVVNTVVYTCGHACMCFECSQKIMRDRRPCCPICRARVKDIIRVYHA